MLTQEKLLSFADRIGRTLWARLNPYNREIAEILNPRDVQTPIYRVSDAGVRLQDWVHQRIRWARDRQVVDGLKLKTALEKADGKRPWDSPEWAEAYRIRGVIAFHEDAAKELERINEDMKAEIDRDHNQERRG